MHLSPMFENVCYMFKAMLGMLNLTLGSFQLWGHPSLLVKVVAEACPLSATTRIYSLLVYEFAIMFHGNLMLIMCYP